jgi:anti-sigma-K factor RskA
MKNNKELNRDLIHKILDGDAAPDEQLKMIAQVQADADLKKEFDDIAGALHSLETSERMPAPAFFTAEVMRRLPPKKAPIGRQVWNFLFKGRALKWNMATVFAATAILALIFTQVVRTGHTPVEIAAVSQQEQVVTVTMNLHAPEAHHVSVAGTFNKWRVDTNVLTKQENGVWTISIPLKPGEYNYMFVVDGKAWITDPNAETYSDDGFGNKNAVVRVKI